MMLVWGSDWAGIGDDGVPLSDSVECVVDQMGSGVATGFTHI